MPDLAKDDQNLKTAAQKSKEERLAEDDGSRYIFPAGEAAPGSNIAPANPEAPPSPEEIAGQVNQAVPQEEQQSEKFINPNQVAQEPVRSVAATPEASQPQAQVSSPEIPAVPNSVFNEQEKQIKEVGDKEAKLHEERAKYIETQLQEDEKNVPHIEPKDFFAGKSTWQKVLGGVGMFLGSITPEGARNVASIVEKEINRDMEAQKLNIKLGQDKKDKRFQMMIQKYGSEEAALLAKKKMAFDLLDLHLKKLEMTSKSQEARARLAMGREELDLKRQELGVKAYQAAMKAQQEQNKGAIPGYKGSISDPTAAREFRNQVTSAKTAFTEIDNLLNINKKGVSSAFSPSDRASAEQSQTLLQGQLREILVGPGAVSEGERALLKDAIANPTSFFSLKSSNTIKLTKLKQAIQRKIDANAAAYGLSKNGIPGARKIQ